MRTSSIAIAIALGLVLAGCTQQTPAADAASPAADAAAAPTAAAEAAEAASPAPTAPGDLLDHDFRPLAGDTPVNLREAYAGKFGGAERAEQVLAQTQATGRAEGLPFDFDRGQVRVGTRTETGDDLAIAAD